MDDTKLVPIAHDNLDQLKAIAEEHGMPRSIRWYKRLLFSDFQKDEPEKCRGYLVQSESEGVVGCLCLAPIEGWFRQNRKTFFRVASFACKKKYGVHALELVAEVVERANGCLTFTNSIANDKSYACWKFARFKDGPEACKCEFSRNFGFLGDAIHSPCFRKRSILTRLAKLLLVSLDAIERKVLSILCPPSCRVLRDFARPEFVKFWKECLSHNDGIMTSRDPRILSELFNDSLHAGTMKLLAKFSGADIVGYILLRKTSWRWRWYTNYRIADICAIGKETAILNELMESAVAYCASQPCLNLSYIGGDKTAVTIISKYLPQRGDVGHQTFVYSVDDKGMQDSLAKDGGWFWGPYDGDHCLGYAGYVDL